MDPLFVKFARWDRMDTMCVFFIFVSYWFYLRGVHRNNSGSWLASGASAALVFLTHPYGFLSFLVVTVHSIFTRTATTKRLLLFYLPLFCFLLGWGLYIFQSPNDFAIQMQYQFRKKIRSPLEMMQVFLSQYRFVPAYLLVLGGALSSVVWGWKKFRSRDTSFLLMSVGAAVLSFLLSFEIYYHLYLFPIVIVAFSWGVFRFLALNSKVIIVARMIVLAAIVLNGLSYTTAYVYLYKVKLKEKANHHLLCQQILTHIPDNSLIGHRGYPTIYWALRDFGKESMLRELYVLNEDEIHRELRNLDYIVFTQSHIPSADEVATTKDRDYFERALQEEGRTLALVAKVGYDERNAYRAHIYKVDKSSENVQSREKMY